MARPKHIQEPADDGVDEGAGSNSRLSQKLKAKIGGGEGSDDDIYEESGDDDEDEGFVIGDSDDDDEGGDGQTRLDRKRERGRIYQENQRLHQENREMLERVARLEGLAQHVQNQPPPQYMPPPQQGPDPVDQELQGVYRDQQRLYELARYAQSNGQMTPEKQQEYIRDLQEIESRKHALYARKNGAQQNQGQGGGAVQAITAIMQGKHPDVFGNPAALRYAKAEYDRRVAVGEPTSMDTADAAMESARQAFGMGQGKRGSRNHRPSQATRERYAGAPRGTTGRPSAPARTMKLSQEQKNMAESMYPDLPPKKAYQKWVNKVGRKVTK